MGPWEEKHGWRAGLKPQNRASQSDASEGNALAVCSSVCVLKARNCAPFTVNDEDARQGLDDVTNSTKARAQPY